MPPSAHVADCWAADMDAIYPARGDKRRHNITGTGGPNTTTTTTTTTTSAAAPVEVVKGPIIVGAGPAGLATAASLQEQGIPSTILERADCIASLWKYGTYDRLHLHIPKHLCELPGLPFPADYPLYPTRAQFVDYLDAYAARFALRPRFNHTVASAAYDPALAMWRVRVVVTSPGGAAAGTTTTDQRELLSKWLVVATGENAEPVLPALPGGAAYTGPALHSSRYRNGAALRDRDVLVVGCGNSGMEIALDLANHGARPCLAVRSPVHVLPREVMGRSTLQVAMALLTVFPVWLTDYLLVLFAWLMMGDTKHYGLCRPAKGPMELKDKAGKTPVLDVGTVAKIRSGHIKVTCAVLSLTPKGAKFADGTTKDFDCIIWATGFRSNVPKWLKDDTVFGADGLPKAAFPHGWKGTRGLYVAGMSKRGLKGTAFEARQIAHEISSSYEKHIFVCPLPPPAATAAGATSCPTATASWKLIGIVNPSTQGHRTSAAAAAMASCPTATASWKRLGIANPSTQGHRTR